VSGAGLVPRLEPVVESAPFRHVVTALILLNAVIIGLETYADIRTAYGDLLKVLDHAVLYLFTLELLLRFLAAGFPFFKSGWNWFDIIVVGVGFVPGEEFITVVRLFRILRVLRALTVLPDLQRIVSAFLRSLPSLGHVVLLLALLTYVYAAMGTFLYHTIAPDRFGTLHQSLLSLFAVLTLEGWLQIMDAILPDAGWAWLYFVSFILLGTFTALNFFVGVIVNNLQTVPESERSELNDIRASLARIEARLGLPEPALTPAVPASLLEAGPPPDRS